MRDLASNRGGKWLVGDLIGELAMRGGDSFLDSGERFDGKKLGGRDISWRSWLVKGGERWLVRELVGVLTCNQCRQFIEAKKQENFPISSLCYVLLLNMCTKWACDSEGATTGLLCISTCIES